MFFCTLTEKLLVCSGVEIKAMQEESVEPKAGRSLSSCELPEEISEPSEGVSRDLIGTELNSTRDLEIKLQKSRREPQELGSVCSSQSLVLPVVTKSSAVSYDVFNC